MKQHRYLALIIVFSIANLSAVAAEQEIITYDSAQVNCEWLDIEYEVIKSRAQNLPPAPTPPVTSAGIMMTFGMLLTLPLEIASSVFGDKKPRYDFSRNVEDIAVAANNKNCKALLQLMEDDKRAGHYPPPPPLNQ